MKVSSGAEYTIDAAAITPLECTTVTASEQFNDFSPLERKGFQFQRCKHLRITLGKDTYKAGLYDVSVTNLPIVTCCGCREEFKGQILFVPGPTIAAIAPDALCVVDEARDMDVTGERFLLVDDAPSELFLKPESTKDVSGYFRSADGCSSLTLNNHNNGACTGVGCNDSHTTQLCNHYAVEVPKAPTQVVDRATVTLGSVHTEDQCTSDAQLLLFPAPAIFDVFPPAVVYGQTHEVLLTGQNFLTVSGVPPRIFLKFDDGIRDDQAIPNEDVALLKCEASDIESAYSKFKISKCSQAKIQLDASTAPIGLYTVRIENPPPILGSDIQTVSGKIQVVTQPQLFSVESGLVCSHADARTLELTGVGLISLDGVTTTVEIDNADVTFIAARSCKTRNTTNQNSNVAVSTCDRYTVSVKQRSPATAAIAPTVATKHPGKTASQSQIT